MTPDTVTHEALEHGPTPIPPGKDVPAYAEPFNLRSPVSVCDGVSGKTVYYDPDVHTRREVLEEYLRVNTAVHEAAGDWGLYGRITRQYDGEWVDVALDVLGPFDVCRHSAGKPGTCGICGDEYSGSYAAHYVAEHGD